MASPRSTATDGTNLTWTLNDRLRKARRFAGLNAQQLADAIGVSRGTVSNYENDHVTPDRRTLIAWAFATGVSLAWIETGNIATIQPDPGEQAGNPPKPPTGRKPRRPPASTCSTRLAGLAAAC